MNSTPLVSIIAVCYNQDKWVEQTLNSIKQQTYANIQLIIADDGSADRSKYIIQNWIKHSYPSAIFINHKQNLGLTKNINTAIPFIEGEYYHLFGCDDIMLPHKIEKQVQLMQENKNIGIIYSDMFLIDSDNKLLNQSYFEKHVYKLPKSGWLYDDLIDRFIIAAPSVLIRRKVLDELDRYNESLDYEDHDFFLRASRKFEFLYIPDKTVKYRITGQSLSTLKNNLKFFKNSFLIFYQNFDNNKLYKTRFIEKLIFYTKHLYSLKFKYGMIYFGKAFIKTHNIIFLKYSVASLLFFVQRRNKRNE